MFLPFPVRIGYELVATTVQVTGVGNMARKKAKHELQKVAYKR